MNTNDLDAGIYGDCGIEIAGLWDRFEIFEALHHTMTIDNPMTSTDLDEVVSLLAPTDGEAALDLACGHGELLRRLRASAEISGRGVDLSPWMLSSAHRLSVESAPDLQWVLDDAKDHGIKQESIDQSSNVETFDLTTCLGASWVWHGFASTVRALAQRTKKGGRIAIGDMVLRDGIDAGTLTQSHGAIESIEELETSFDTHGLSILGRVRTADDAWDDYLKRTKTSATAWAQLHPGERSDSYVAEQQQWEHDHARDREILTWSVWVAEKR